MKTNGKWVYDALVNTETDVIVARIIRKDTTHIDVMFADKLLSCRCYKKDIKQVEADAVEFGLLKAVDESYYVSYPGSKTNYKCDTLSEVIRQVYSTVYPENMIISHAGQDYAVAEEEQEDGLKLKLVPRKGPAL